TALVFDGPALVGRINQGLAELLRRDGFASVGEAIGTAQGASTAQAWERRHSEVSGSMGWAAKP
ncbi:MAG: hypothetical protein WB678_06830, partial [Stellaceae bacterium]